VPAEMVFIPQRPQKTQAERAGGDQVAEAAPDQLLRRGFAAVEADDAQAAQHHAGSGAAEDGEERHVLRVEEREDGEGHGDVEAIEREVSAERAEEGQDCAESEKQQRQIQEAGAAAFGWRRHGIELMLAGFAGTGRGTGLAQEARRDGDFEMLEPRLRLGLRARFLPRRGAQGVGNERRRACRGWRSSRRCCRKGQRVLGIGIAQALTARTEFFEARGDFFAPVVGRGIDGKIAERGTNFGRRRRFRRAIGETQARVAKAA